MKFCNKCKEEKPFEAFSKKYKGYQSECKECRSAYTKQHYLANKKKYIDRAREKNKVLRASMTQFLAELKNVPCMDCNRTFDPVCMDFDHVRGEKIGNVSAMAAWTSKKLILKEVAKCEIVCACCHRLRTKNRLQK